MRFTIPQGAAISGLALLLAASGAAAAPLAASVVLRDNTFQPATLNLPAGKKIRLLIENTSSQVAEFESYDLNREKIIPAGSSTTLYIGPLKSGSYEFFNDFNRKTHGRIVVE
jgi:plastocyanin